MKPSERLQSVWERLDAEYEMLYSRISEMSLENTRLQVELIKAKELHVELLRVINKHLTIPFAREDDQKSLARVAALMDELNSLYTDDTNETKW